MIAPNNNFRCETRNRPLERYLLFSEDGSSMSHSHTHRILHSYHSGLWKQQICGPPGVQSHCRPSNGCASQCQEQIQKMDQVSLPANAGDTGSIPRSGRSPGVGNGNPLQCSQLGNPMDRGACQAAVHGVAKESDMTEQLNKHNCQK